MTGASSMIALDIVGASALTRLAVRGNEKESITAYNKDSIPKNQIWASLDFSFTSFLLLEFKVKIATIGPPSSNDGPS